MHIYCYLQKEGKFWSILQNQSEVENLVNLVAQNLESRSVCRSRRGGYTPLLWVCWKIHGDITLQLIQLLLWQGSDVNATDDEGWNSLHYLCRYHHFGNLKEAINILLKEGIDVNAKTANGFNALHLLCCYQACDKLEHGVRLFLEAGIDVNAKTSKGFTALHFICRNYPHSNLKNILELMLEYGAKVNEENRNSWTALHFVCRFYKHDNLLDIVRFLIERSNERKLSTIRNANGQNALECCLLNSGGQFHEIYDFFRENRSLYDFSPVWRAQSLLDLAKIGCLPLVKLFVSQNKWSVVDKNGKSCYDYLLDVLKNSLVLCRKCLASVQNPIHKEEEALKVLRFQLGRREKMSMPFPPFVKESLDERIVKHGSNLVVSKEMLFNIFPDYEDWSHLVNLWNSDDPSEPLEFKLIDQYAQKHSHMNCSGQTATCNWCRVSEHVRAFLDDLMMVIKSLDSRMEADQIIHYGSAAEFSKLFLPNEFDFAVILKHFNQSKIGSLNISYDGIEKVSSVFYRNPNQNSSDICSGRLLLYYGLLVEEALRRIDWHRHIFNPCTNINETCVTLSFYYRHRGYEGHLISVDLTLAVPGTSTSGIKHSNSSKLYIVPNRADEVGCKWQFSSFTLEKDMLLRPQCRGTVVHVLRLLKLIVCLNKAKPQERRMCRDGDPSTYALKTCLFHYMTINPPPWSEEDVLCHCCNVINYFPMKESEMFSFFRDDVIVYHISYSSKRAVQQILRKLNRCFITES